LRSAICRKKWTRGCVRKLGKGGRDVGSNSETFRWNPVGNQSHPVEPASSRKRVLRGDQRWSLRSVDSECLGPAIEPRKITCSWEPLSSLQRGPRRRALIGLARRSCRGPRTGHQHSRILREPERSHRLHGNCRIRGNRHPKPQARMDRVPCGSEARHGNRGSAKRRKRSAA
jgi:hypothetical protein